MLVRSPCPPLRRHGGAAPFPTEPRLPPTPRGDIESRPELGLLWFVDNSSSSYIRQTIEGSFVLSTRQQTVLKDRSGKVRHHLLPNAAYLAEIGVFARGGGIK
jgi:hypothetical protein